jgi:hypothetical protein
VSVCLGEAGLAFLFLFSISDLRFGHCSVILSLLGYGFFLLLLPLALLCYQVSESRFCSF